MQFSTDTTNNLRRTVDSSCLDEKSGIPGMSVVVVGKDGNELFAHSAGKRGCNSTEPMTLENVFWIASCTKMIVGVACMQLVETGALKLDDSDHLEKLCPELKDIKVLQDGKLVPKKIGITLRMLLTHTCM
jgi:CubicO group peptidase (beta-lactamase class C family)